VAADTKRMEERTRQRVVVIEDHSVIRRLIELVVTPLDIDVHATPDGVAGVAAVDRLQPALVVLDIGLPGMDGWTVLEELRTSHSMIDLPILVVSAYSAPSDMGRAYEMGANGYMTKPFHPDDLMDAVDRLLNGGLTV